MGYLGIFLTRSCSINSAKRSFFVAVLMQYFWQSGTTCVRKDYFATDQDEMCTNARRYAHSNYAILGR